MPGIKLVIVAALSVAVTACALTGTRTRLPDRIVAERGGFIPEGIEFDTAAQRFLTGSLVEGTIYQVATDGRLLPFVFDSDLVSSAGLEVDAARDRLLVANGDRDAFGGQVPGIATLGVYRLSTGERIAMVDLRAVTGADEDDIVFPNDVTVAPNGDVYLTDTFMNLIYRVDLDYRPSVLHRVAPITGLGLNGIVHHADDYLIVVAVSGQGLLYKIPLSDPAAARPIALSQPATGADGLVWSADGRLIVISNSSSSILAYTSTDGWETATVTGMAGFEGQATTGAVVGDDIYVVQPHFNDAEPPVILRLRL